MQQWHPASLTHSPQVRFLVADGAHVGANTAYAEMEVMKMLMPLLTPASGAIHLMATEGSAVSCMLSHSLPTLCAVQVSLIPAPIGLATTGSTMHVRCRALESSTDAHFTAQRPLPPQGKPPVTKSTLCALSVLAM